jgi:hypothetical protein
MSDASLIVTFDYAEFESGVGDEMREAAARVRALVRASVLEVGRELSIAKSRVEHGYFVSWVETECQISIRTAQRMMQAAEMVEKNDNLSYLSPDGLHALAARPTPEPIRTAILERINAGERPGAAEIKKEIFNAREAERIAAKEAAMTPRQRRTRAQREAEAQQQREEFERQEERMATAAKAASDLLIASLGERFEEFMNLWEASSYYFNSMTVNERRRNAGL